MTEYIVDFPSNEINDFLLHERIVRCKVCEYRYDYQCGRHPDWFDIELDGYCKWGERKKGLNNDSYN